MAINVGAFVAMRLLREADERRVEEEPTPAPAYSCSNCHHHYDLTTDSVSCCACCEEGEYYWPIKRK